MTYAILLLLLLASVVLSVTMTARWILTIYSVRKTLEAQILREITLHLEHAHEWADPRDLGEVGDWSPLASTYQAVIEGNAGLALTRWDDLLLSPARPQLGKAAEQWRQTQSKSRLI